VHVTVHVNFNSLVTVGSPAGRTGNWFEPVTGLSLEIKSNPYGWARFSFKKGQKKFMSGFEGPSLNFLDCSVLLQILRIYAHGLLSLIAINCDVCVFFDKKI